MSRLIDKSQISLSRICDVRYWVDRFGTNATRLREVVSALGNNPEVVERMLQRLPART